MHNHDLKWMNAALRFGRRHLGLTSSNPSVACLIVREGSVVGRGITAIGGRPHAESLALDEAGANAKGATAYVTLEPCAHHGKTPPCCDVLIGAGIARVVYAVKDPNPLTAGQGKQKMQAAGVEVLSEVCEYEAARDHAGHIIAIEKQRPFLQLKLAVTANGVMGRRNNRLLITGENANTFTHRLRSQADAIAVGSGTVLADDPLLTCRLQGLEKRSPRRVILDRRLRTPVTSAMVQSAFSFPTTLMTTSGHDCSLLTAANMSVEILPENNFLLEGLHLLAQSGVRRLLVEGGVKLAQSLLEQNLVDELVLIQSDINYHSDDALFIPDLCKAEKLAQNFKKFDERLLGNDHVMRFWRN